MKRLVLQPGFECIFALTLIAIIGLPPLVMGQDKKGQLVKKKLEINIKDGDTVVNGKNIKNMSAKERDEFLDNIAVDAHAFKIMPRPDGKRHHIIIKGKGINGNGDIIVGRTGGPDGEFHVYENEDERIVNDSLGKKLGLKLRMMRDMPAFAFDFKPDDDDLRPGREMLLDDGPRLSIGRPFDNFSRPNSQSFNYTSTDDEGISTHVSYRVNDASPEKLSKIAGIDKATLTIKDIHLSPEFSTGKTVLKFNLPANKSFDVQFKDSQGKVLWSATAAAQKDDSFSKTFALGLNGAYYLQVKSGSEIALKRIVKED